MNNFSELLDTELLLTVSVNGQEYQQPLLDTMSFCVTDTVFVDGIEVLPHYQHLAVDGQLIINQPFYQWYHTVSGQGWLLKPQYR
jgi:hypothetical protein